MDLNPQRDRLADFAELERKLAAVQGLSAEKRAEADRLMKIGREKVDEVKELQARVSALEALRPWYALTTYKLERNDCSRIHKLTEALLSSRVILADNKTAVQPGERAEILMEEAQPFVVQHDWASAFENATDYDEGEFNLPFEHCAFEFRVSGRTVIVVAFQPSDETLARVSAPPGKYDRMLAIPYVECGGYWWCREELGRDDPALQFVWNQVRAICIALDAEVATREVMRAPAKLNEKRQRAGALPIRDFHVVKLRGRAVRQQLPSAGGTHRSPRMHFRRGHWRHYEAHKTWIRWTLVGDPDLGFIDKAYRL